MVSFRYFLVTLVAIFLALATGILMGTTVIRGTVIETLRTRADEALTEARRLRDDAREWTEFAEALTPRVVEDRLRGQPVLLVTEESVDAAEIDGVRRILEQSGAQVMDVLLVMRKTALPDAASRTELAAILERPESDPPSELVDEAATELGVRLANGSVGSGADILVELVRAQFLSTTDLTVDDLDALGGQEQALVILSGGRAPPLVPPEGFFMPLVRSLVAQGQEVAAGETETTVYPFVELLRDDDEMRLTVTTVDNADGIPGQVAMVLALRDLLITGQVGHYGVKPGRDALLPPAE